MQYFWTLLVSVFVLIGTLEGLFTLMSVEHRIVPLMDEE
jgi:hypothetical protein